MSDMRKAEPPRAADTTPFEDFPEDNAAPGDDSFHPELSWADEDDGAVFLAPPSQTAPLAETENYRPGALVAVIFLAPPVASALALVALMWSAGGAPYWAPLLLLLWLPLLLAGLFALRGVRLTREQIAIGRPLGAWRVIPLASVTRLEARGLRLVLTLGAQGDRVSFIPALLGRGGQLRRQLLLSLPLNTLAGDARAEAAFLLEGAFPESGAENALAVRPPLRAPGLAALVTVALAMGAVVAGQSHMTWLMDGLGAAAALSLLATFWLAQEVVINERGIAARLTRSIGTASVTWDELTRIYRAPGELALLLRGQRAFICPGPGMLSARDARRVRQTISYYVRERGLMTAPRASR